MWTWIASGTMLTVLVAALIFAQIGLAPQVVQAQESTPATPALPRTITVVGEGTVNIKPDVAQANIGVEVVKPTVKEASAEAKSVMESVLAALKGQGVEDKDIQTSGYSIWADRSYGPEGPSDAESVRYRVSNNVSVTIRNLDNVGTVLDAAIEAGANNIYGVNFSLDNSSAAESSARQKAVANAQEKAKELASLNGVEVGNVISVSEVIGGSGAYYSGGLADMASRAGLGGGGGPISPGELQLKMQLQVVYELK
jgi:uncharacterized protein YggE